MGHPSMDSRYGAVVLCGGRSSRMGQDKASLPFGGETLLTRVVRIVSKVVPDHNIVVVADVDQKLPSLPSRVQVIGNGDGPLPALIAGLGQLPEFVEAAFVTACDAPLLKPAVIERLLRQWAALQAVATPPERRFIAVAPADGWRMHPLCAVYGSTCRVGLAATAAFAGNRSLRGALDSEPMHTLRVPLEELRAIDPELDSLVNCNTPEEYEWALRRGGGD